MDSFNYTDPDWQDVSKRTLEYGADGQPVLTIRDFGKGGKKIQLTGMQALKYAPKDQLHTTENESYIAPPYFGDDDYRDSFRYNAGRSIREFMDDPDKTWLGKLFDKGPVWGLGLGAGGGWLAGKGLELLLNRNGQGLPWGTIGLIGGAVLGGTRGAIGAADEDRKAYQAAMLAKQASMYRDPRNFILEKLQGATDITPFEKAQLAARIRQMNLSEAEQLKSKVRAALGFGVGALIARYVFKRGMGGSVIGGLIGALGSRMLPRGNRPNTGIFQGNYF